MKRTLFALFLFGFSGCGTMQTEKNEDLFQQRQEEDETISRAQLQEDVQRFAGGFMDRINQAVLVVEEKLPAAETTLLRQQLLYSSAAVEIASGQNPEANLLDMLAMVRLSKDRVKDYWIPEVFGPPGKDLLEAFQESEAEIQKIGNRLLGQKEWAKFYEILGEWMNQNQDLVLVERIRLTEISVARGEGAFERAEEVEGLLANLKKAVSTAGQGALLANRALWLSHHFPYLARLQGRLAAQQIMGDALQNFKAADEQLGKTTKKANPLLNNMTALARQTGETAKEVESLLSAYRKHFPQKQEADPGQGPDLGKINSIAKNLIHLSANLEEGTAAARQTMESVSNQLHDLIWTLSFALLALVAGSGAVWWGGYWLAKRRPGS